MTTSATLRPPTPERLPARYAWATRGDVNAFFGLMLDNIGDMILMAILLQGFGFPHDFVVTRMIPGTAVGVLVGDLIFTGMAFGLARRSGRSEVTAMPLGLDTPSTFGSVLFILGPSFLAARGRGLDPLAAAQHAWFLGIAMILASGVFKLACAPFAAQVRRLVPRAGLLGSLSAIALVLISFLPLIEIAKAPVAGMVALGVILISLTARWRLPGNLPGALAALILGCLVYYGMHLLGLGPGLGGGETSRPESVFRWSLPIPLAEWWAWLPTAQAEAVSFLPIALPLALVTVIGGIDCTESAGSVGDEYPTGRIVAAEGFATLVAGVCGGVIQSTPYIGHPAYKAMGARAAYTLATALFVGAAGVFGFFDWIFYLLPKAAVFPILIFVGLEITAQSFRATPTRHYPAVALACVPALAYLALLVTKQFAPTDADFVALRPDLQQYVQTLTVLAGGFIVSSLLWGTALAHVIDGRVRPAVVALVLAAVGSLFGVIHSPLPEAPIRTPGSVVRDLTERQRFEASRNLTPYHWASAYAGAAALLIALGAWGRRPEPTATMELVRAD